MRRRRRQPGEIAFGFDSFLDLVANVVGIIIRLILVVWVGARAYTSLKPLPAPPPAEPAAETTPADDAGQRELTQLRSRLAEAQARLLQELEGVRMARRSAAEAEGRLTALAARRRQLETERTALDGQSTAGDGGAALTLEELRQRSEKLALAVESLQKTPPARKVLRYRTPVSKPVEGEELHFECKAGRVTFLDVAALLAEVRRGLTDKGQALRTQWQVKDTAGPVGPFRLHYVVERERGTFDLIGGVPDDGGGFRYGVSSWEVEPIGLFRGATLQEALAPGSEFRRLTDVLDPRLATVTFWVYPDSFALFRELRDHLYERDVVVAGRPLPDGVPIASSRRGTASRGQ